MIRWEGLDKLEKQLDVKALEKFRGPLKLEAELIMTKAKRITPVAPDGGTLRASGHVQAPKVGRNTLSIILGFGGAASAYALAVHEHPSKHSPPSWAGGVTWNVHGPGFLRKPMKEAEKGFGKRLSAHLDLW